MVAHLTHHAALRGVRQRLICFAGNSLISHQDNQNRYLRAYEPLSNAHESRIKADYIYIIQP